MRRLVFTLALILMLGPAALVQAQRLPGDPGAEKGTVPADNPFPETPDNALLEANERDEKTVFADDPMSKLVDALDELSEGDRETAARTIEEAAKRTQEAAGRSNGSIRAALVSSADTLMDLSSRLKAGGPAAADDFAPVFARNLQVMTRFHAERALMNWGAYEEVDAGYELRAAAANLDRALEWAEPDDDLGIPNVVTEADYAANLIISEQAVDRRDVERIIGAVDQASRLLGDRLGE